MSNKVPPGTPRDRRRDALPDADLDADLWSSPSEEPAANPVRVPPWLRVVPAQDSPDGSPSGLVAYYQDSSEPAAAPAAPVPEPDRAATRQEPSAPAGVYLTGPAPRGRALTRQRRVPPRERLRLERQRLARRRRRIRLVAVGAALAVLIAAGAVGYLLHHQAARQVTIVKAGASFSGPYAPVTINSNDSVTMAQPGVTKPVLDVYEDFQCPPCRAFEKANGGVIQELAAAGKIKVVYYPFTIFSGQPQLANSTRAWAAAKCAPAAEWVAYHNDLFAAQPALTAVGGFPVSQLIQLGRKAGITSQAFAGCVRSQRYAGLDATVSNQVLGNGPDGLPTLKLNGQLLTLNPASPALRQKLISASS
jgi:hypothetical protein